MANIFDMVGKAYSGYANYFWQEITNPGWHNYFYWLLGVSFIFLLLEWQFPWRKKQARFRKDFWLDAFYMFFNFFLFSLIIYNAFSEVVVHFFNDAIYSLLSIDLQAINPMSSWPYWAILLTGFLVRDFIQWWVHRLLHRSDRLWEFHKVHHSVEEMGFAAHLRYHWMETIVYRTCEYIPLALLGIGLYDFFVIHIFALVIGHYNHSNLTVSGKITGGILGALLGIIFSQGLMDLTLLHFTAVSGQIMVFVAFVLFGVFGLGHIMKIIFNNPEMHIWHHAYEVPEDRKYGINFGISLALWDYIFRTAYIPKNGRDIRLGFPGIEQFPSNFQQQIKHGFGGKP